MSKQARIVLDIAVLVVYVFATLPAFTGVPLHEYLGIGAFVVLLVHVLVGADGIVTHARPWNILLNVALLVSLAITAISGVFISGDVLPALGFYATGYRFWDPLHALAAKVLLALLIVHIALRVPMLALWFGHHRRHHATASGADISSVGCETSDGHPMCQR